MLHRKKQRIDTILNEPWVSAELKKKDKKFLDWMTQYYKTATPLSIQPENTSYELCLEEILTEKEIEEKWDGEGYDRLLGLSGKPDAIFICSKKVDKEKIVEIIVDYKTYIGKIDESTKTDNKNQVMAYTYMMNVMPNYRAKSTDPSARLSLLFYTEHGQLTEVKWNHQRLKEIVRERNMFAMKRLVFDNLLNGVLFKRDGYIKKERILKVVAAKPFKKAKVESLLPFCLCITLRNNQRPWVS